MNIIFMGTPQFAVGPLEKLYNSKKHKILAVVSQPDREKDKKGNLLPTAVKIFCENVGLKLYQFEKVSRDGIDIIRALRPDIVITAAYGQLLSQEFLDIPAFGTLNLHASILPKYRGSSPIQAAILAGDTETGITIMRTELSMDTGDILAVRKTPINETTSYSDLEKTLSDIGSELILEVLDSIEDGSIRPVKQDNQKVTYTKKIVKSDGLIDFNESADKIIRKINAFNPWPTAYAFFNGNMLKIYSAQVINMLNNNFKSGEVLSGSKEGELIIKCGINAIKILSIQAPGKKILNSSEFLRGYKIEKGDKIE